MNPLGKKTGGKGKSGAMPMGWKAGLIILILFAMAFAGMWLKSKSEEKAGSGSTKPASKTSAPAESTGSAATATTPAAAEAATAPSVTTASKTSAPDESTGSAAAATTPAAAGQSETEGQSTQPVAASTGEDGGPSFLDGEPEEKEAQMPGISSSLIRVLIGLGVVVLLIVVARFVMKKLGPGRPTKSKDGPLQVLSYTGMGHNSGIYTVKIGDRVLLVGSSEKGLSLIREVSGDELAQTEKDAEPALGSGFENTLDRTVSGATHGRRDEGWKARLDALRWKTVRRPDRTT